MVGWRRGGASILQGGQSEREKGRRRQRGVGKAIFLNCNAVFIVASLALSDALIRVCPNLGFFHAVTS